MEDRKIIELYNYRSENALIETDKKYVSIPIKMSTFFGNSEHPFPEK